MKLFWITSVIVLFLIQFPGRGIAQEHDSGEFVCSECMAFDALWNAEVISASRKVQKKNEAAGSVVVITAEMIEKRGYRTLEEVIEDLPGIDFSVKQPAGEYPTHFVCRGITDVGQTNLLIIVDGIIMNDVSNGWIRHIGYEFPLFDVERIEFIYGPGSALYGANAYAGIIYILTKNPDEIKDGTNLQARMAYGSWNSFSPELYYSGKYGNGLKLQFTGQWYYTQGDGGLNRYDPGNYFHNNYEPDSVLTTEYGNIANQLDATSKTKKLPDGFNTSLNDMHFRFKASQGGFSFGLSYWLRNEGLSSEVVGYEYFTNTPDIQYSAMHSGKSLYSKYEFDITDRFHSSSLLSFRSTRILPQTGFVYTYQYQSVDNGINPAVEDKLKGYSGEGNAVRFEQQFNVNLKDNNELVFGFHLESLNRQYFGISLGELQDATSTIVSSTYPTENVSVMPMYFSENFSLFVQDEIKFFEKYTLTAGLRYDFDSDFGDVFIPRIALVGNPNQNFSFKLLSGRAFKAPTVFQLFDEWRGNEKLNPQYINTYELELGYKFEKKLNLRGNFYYSNIKDYIVVEQNPDTSLVPIGPNGEKATYYQNLGSFSILGTSLFLHYKPFDKAMISLNYSFTIDDQFQEIDNIAAHKINLSFNYQLSSQFYLNLRANYYGKVKAPETNLYFYPKTTASINSVGYDYVTEEKPDGYIDPIVLFNLTLSTKYIFWRRMRIEPQLIVRNVLGTEYFTIGRQSGSGVRPVDAIQTSIQNPAGFIPAYHPQAGRQIYLRLFVEF